MQMHLHHITTLINLGRLIINNPHYHDHAIDNLCQECISSPQIPTTYRYGACFGRWFGRLKFKLPPTFLSTITLPPVIQRFCVLISSLGISIIHAALRVEVGGIICASAFAFSVAPPAFSSVSTIKSPLGFICFIWCIQSISLLFPAIYCSSHITLTPWQLSAWEPPPPFSPSMCVLFALTISKRIQIHTGSKFNSFTTNEQQIPPQQTKTIQNSPLGALSLICPPINIHTAVGAHMYSWHSLYILLPWLEWFNPFIFPLRAPKIFCSHFLGKKKSNQHHQAKKNHSPSFLNNNNNNNFSTHTHHFYTQ